MKTKKETLAWYDDIFIIIELSQNEQEILRKAAEIAANIQDLLPQNGQDEYRDQNYCNASDIENGALQLLKGIKSKVLIPEARREQLDNLRPGRPRGE